jgi:predicted XRE-type DNA-binding protein
MINSNVTKINRTINLENTKDTKLSIQFNLDGFSFCISDNSTGEILYFFKNLFEDKQTTPENLMQKVDAIFKKDAFLQKDFSSVLVVHENNLSTLVPNKYFSEDKLLEYLNFNIKTLATDYIAFDDVPKINVKNVYVPYIPIINYLFQNFGAFEYKHHTTIFIEKLLSLSSSEEKKVYVNVSSKSFDVVVIQNKKLQFSNSFEFETKEDFIYYILFTFEQLNLDVEKVKLYFTGDIELESEIYNSTYQYIRNVFFLESNNSIFNTIRYSKHSNYILLGS